MEKLTVIDTWLRKHRLIYLGATRHSFVISIRDGTVDFSGFKIWLVCTFKYLILLSLSLYFLFLKRKIANFVKWIVNFACAGTRL